MNVNNHSPEEPENGCFLHKDCDFMKKGTLEYCIIAGVLIIGCTHMEDTTFLNKGKISEQEALR